MFCTATSWPWSGWSCLEDTEGLGRLGRRAARAEGGARGCVMMLGEAADSGGGLAMMTFSYLLLVCLSSQNRQTLSRQPKNRATWGREMKKRGLEWTYRACRAGSVGYRQA